MKLHLTLSNDTLFLFDIDHQNKSVQLLDISPDKFTREIFVQPTQHHYEGLFEQLQYLTGYTEPDFPSLLEKIKTQGAKMDSQIHLGFEVFD